VTIERIKEAVFMDELGLMSGETWNLDPRRLGFLLARYKFVAKMFSGFDSVLEVGCADAFGTRVVSQSVGLVTAIDKDARYVGDANCRMSDRWPFTCLVHDMLSGPIEQSFDGAYSLDVLEHIRSYDEDIFLGNIKRSLSDDGCAIFGMPSIESQTYASPLSRDGHVNCKTGTVLKETLERHFRHVFSFGMSDEVVHTGFSPMCHYLLALCVK